MMQKPDYKYDKIESIPLDHLPGTEIAISRMTGGPIPNDKKQYFVNTHYQPEHSEKIAFTKGFSIQLDQIPVLCARLLEIYDKERAKNRGAK
jgi:hypothetical protein